MTPSPLYRIMDANLNRCCEGLRVLEDMLRFVCEDAALSMALRNLRHSIRKETAALASRAVKARDSERDPGLVISQNGPPGKRSGMADVAVANCKRVQEALRSLEEQAAGLSMPELCGFFESCRFRTYTLEKRILEALIPENRRNILNTDIYAITASEHSKGRSNIDVVRQMMDADIRLVQYREKDKSLREKYEECREIRKITKDYGVKFVVNDDVDLALMVGADGVHIGQDDWPLSAVRELVGETMAIGLSTHSPEQAAAALASGADYIGVGPIFETRTKKDVCDPVGFTYLEHVVSNIPLPFVAIGGIKAHNIHEVAKRGASCICLVTEITGAEDIGGKIKEIRNILSKKGK
ncbi:thiamine-phosphate pyrophosphorylase [Desulfobotulus alkaliphilus]|uniref:Thiamine-phosphate synthase n=1 Tax=Desulfobotulus alkaliphilus TaxID=622671 RepID=A0A562S2Q0_9BACT|nr:thiamine phosphate synthase [Desulfobotulus alkaliphilus]TWI75428.1 thiamine-phosphate pyrophosphorylase [Desulfobotulus alkaliphilus]